MEAQLKDGQLPIRRYISEAGIRELPVARLARPLAMVRLDELMDAQSFAAMTTSDDGAGLHFDRAARPPAPPPRGELYGADRIIHEDRLVCPALQVEGLVGLAAHIMTETVVQLREYCRTS